MPKQNPIILVLASTFPRWKNDTEPRFVYDLCQKLKNDFKIIVLAPHSIDSLAYEVMDDLRVVRYRYAPTRLETLAYEGGITAKLKDKTLNWLMLPFFFIGQWVAIIKLLRQYPVKVIHAHWLIPQGILALMARLVSKNKPSILCTSHGGDLYGLNDPISKAIKCHVINKIDELTVVSSSMQGKVGELVPQATIPTVAPMGTDLAGVFTPNESIQRIPYQLLFVGRLVEKKGLQYLLQALPEIIKHNPSITLNIAGSGPEQDNLEKLTSKLELKKHVSFLGRLTHEQLVTQYQTASIAVFPFIQAKDGDVEGLGLVMIEAMGCGCPVVASDIPAVHDVITDNKTGILVPPKNHKEIQKNILAFFVMPEEKKKLLGKKGRESILKKFCWSVVAQQYTSLIKNNIKRREK